MGKNILIIVGLLLLVWIVQADKMPSLVGIGHEIAKHILPPAK
ncbi:hypothetical protein [Acinetobacter bouvetii]|jgi:hypothetical protein|nr:hypothetical protein [Acinetobacter bouvetii]